jgi:predicted outer membrane protein
LSIRDNGEPMGSEPHLCRRKAIPPQVARPDVRAGDCAGCNKEPRKASHQVTEHQAALDLFDNTLIPSAQNAQLKDSLKQVRPMVAEHLQEAKSIQGSLLAK